MLLVPVRAMAAMLMLACAPAVEVQFDGGDLVSVAEYGLHVHHSHHHHHSGMDDSAWDGGSVATDDLADGSGCAGCGDCCSGVAISATGIAFSVSPPPDATVHAPIIGQLPQGSVGSLERPPRT